MTSYVSSELRRLVETRADHLCEYCLVHEADTFFGCHVDHIISEKHGGKTEADNLCLACAFCNRAKGTDIGSIAPSTGEYVRFYNPRTDHWSEHFQIVNANILTLTPIAEATASILGFNTEERIGEREALLQIERYPTVEAKRAMQLP